MPPALSPAALADRIRNHALNDLRAAALLSALSSSADAGLDPVLVPQRRREFGENALPPPPAPWYLALIWDGLHDTTIIMLVLAAIVSLVLALVFNANDATAWIEGAAILGTVAVVLNVQAWTDYRTASAFRQQQLDLERGLHVDVIRGGVPLRMHPREVVVGDVMRVSVGDILACDGILLGGDDIRVDESALTGESKAVVKPQGEILLSGTNVVNGQGRMLVLAVGTWSVQGKLLLFVQNASAQTNRNTNEREENEDFVLAPDDHASPVAPAATLEQRATDVEGGGGAVVNVPLADDNSTELPPSVFSFSTSKVSDRSVSPYAANSSLRSAQQESARSRDVTVPGRKETRCRKFWSTLFQMSSGGGGSLMDKLDTLAINIGKLGLFVAVVVFIVTSSQWAIENYVYGNECNVFDSNQTRCEAQLSWGCYWQGAPANCAKQWAAGHDLERLLQFFITSVTILVVAVPEGLPLAVTLSISVSMRRMLRDNNQVKTMQSSETMGSATTICSDKTGTLTQNRMTVTRVAFGDGKLVFEQDLDRSLGVAAVVLTEQAAIPSLAPVCALWSEAVAVCSESTSSATRRADGVWDYSGNATESALLRLAAELGHDPNATRRAFALQAAGLDWGVKTFAFSSSRKRMSWIVRQPSGALRLYTKGAPSFILDSCFGAWSASGVRPMDPALRRQLGEIVDAWQSSALRTLAVAYRDLQPGDPWVEGDCILLALVGMEDPLRPTVKQAVATCRKAGVDVRMCTGDALETAVAIAQQCGVLRKRDMEKGPDGRLRPRRNYAMTGAELDERVHHVDQTKPKIMRRAWDPTTGQSGEMMAHPFALDAQGNKLMRQHKFDQIWPRLRVLARCLPEDKLVLVRGLQQSRLFERADECERLLRDDDIAIFPDQQVVAVTGDGTNDAPALKQADVGFAMGITGTDIAKQACDIIILDDNFASIVAAVMWGRNVFDSISKFVQFQLTVNITAIVVATVGSFVYDRSPLGAVQMLWVNLIMDSLASLALATEPASPDLMDRPPYGKQRPIISRVMKFNILGQSFYQLVVVFAILFNSSWIPGWDAYFGNVLVGGDNWVTGNVRHFPYDTSIFSVETDQYTQGSGVSTHWSIVFNTFVMMQIFNEFNSRKLQTVQGLRASWREWNVFAGVQRNPLFLLIVLGTFIVQVVLMEKGGLVFAVVPLSWSQWLFCVGFGAISIVWQWVINAVLLLVHPSPSTRQISEPAKLAAGGAGLSRDNSHSSHASAGIAGFFREGSGRIKVNVGDAVGPASP